jgi:DNA-binding MarR family transcriptional regulator
VRTATGEAAELSQLIGELMSRLHRRLAGDSLATINDAGLTMSQFVALHILAQEGGLSVGTVAERLRLSPAATSSLLDRLVQAGLIARTEAPEDRRQKRLAITPKGSALITGVNAERMHEVAALLGRLSPRVRLQFAQVLVRVIEEMAAVEETPP